MDEFDQPERPRGKRGKVARIEEDSATFRWLIPAALVVLSILLFALVAVSVAVIFDVIPLG